MWSIGVVSKSLLFRVEIVQSKKKKRGFTETIELQVGLKNYDPQKDKRFSGSYKLPSVCKKNIKVCVLGDDVHIEEAKKNGFDSRDVEALKALNKNKKLIKKMPPSTMPSWPPTSSSSKSLAFWAHI